MKFHYLLSLALLIISVEVSFGKELKKSTLCRLTNGTTAVCPVKDASCCKSGDFCCPKGFECDLENRRCIKDSLYIPFHLRLRNLQKDEPTKRDILCPDNITTCRDSQTCCQFEGDDYGCCPILKAVCCEDKVHCCPDGYTCNPSQGKCDKNHDLFGASESVDWQKKQPGKKQNLKQTCPGGGAECPAGTTCCQLSTGEYGCCPLENAVCCSDHLHCCPNGYTCDVEDGRCNKGDVSLPFYKKIKAEPKPKTKKIENVVCPGGGAECPAGTTCCELGDGEYGCCPLENAVCCSDHLHCCPNGYTCDVEDGRCNKGDMSMPFYKKVKAIKNKVKDVVCPGGGAQCPDGTTCCELSTGEYGCCPLPNAVCCSDHLHCCPNGYTCDVENGRCNKGDVSLPFYKKTEAIPVKSKNVDVVCPGGGATCPAGTTCCQLSTGEYGCCPLENAVCCSDHLHCCPNGYTCDVEDGRCNKGYMSIPFFKKVEAKKNKDVHATVVCPGGGAECPAGTTCCELSEGEYGCCPLENAVCCSDHLHCCPNGYTCDVEAGRCNKGPVSLPFYKKIDPTLRKKIENTPKQEVKSVVCPDGSSFCPKDYTCCKMADGTFGCCPLPKAVCCADNLHCCPQNTKCNLDKQTCESQTGAINWLEKIKAERLKFNDKHHKVTADPVVCPDNSTCDPLKSCCLMSSIENIYGCCPYSNGVCCPDQNFCCPEGSKCGNSFGECLPKVKVSNKLKVYDVNMHTIEEKAQKLVKKDDSCALTETKCQNSYGNFSCCPYTNGTCCGPEGYCCPKEYTCDSKLETCVYNDPDRKKQTPQPSIKLVTARKRSRFALLELGQQQQCKNAEYSCSDSYTCCSTDSDDTYGCCPVKNAVCCQDGLNCCPSGYSCLNRPGGGCSKN